MKQSHRINHTRPSLGLTNDGNGLRYEYDAADRTTAIVRYTTNRTEFAYDGLGRRVQVIERTNGVAMSTNKYVWCGTELCEERNNTGATVTKRFFGQGEQISGTNYCFTRDHLGSVREVTDSTGAVRARYDYDPYGRRTKLSGNVDADFGYTGHFMLASQPDHTLTMYRLYRPDLGRWCSRDPLGEREGLNLYAYCGNDPMNRVDPDGLSDGWATLISIDKKRDQFQTPVDNAQAGYDRYNQWKLVGYHQNAINSLDMTDPAQIDKYRQLTFPAALNVAQFGADIYGEGLSLLGPKFIKAPLEACDKVVSNKDLFDKAWDITKSGYNKLKNWILPAPSTPPKQPFRYIGPNVPNPPNQINQLNK